MYYVSITAEEHEKIRQVVEKAEALEKSEEERLGYVHSIFFKNEHSEAKNLKKFWQKSREIKYVNLFFCEIAFLVVFPSSKIDFWPFLKMEFGLKNIREINLFDFMSFFGLDSLNFLTHCDEVTHLMSLYAPLFGLIY